MYPNFIMSGPAKLHRGQQEHKKAAQARLTLETQAAESAGHSPGAKGSRWQPIEPPRRGVSVQMAFCGSFLCA